MEDLDAPLSESVELGGEVTFPLAWAVRVACEEPGVDQRLQLVFDGRLALRGQIDSDFAERERTPVKLMELGIRLHLSVLSLSNTIREV